MTKLKQILTVSISIIILLIGIIFYGMATYKAPSPDFYCQIPVPICGTKSPELSENQHKGKEIFNAYCSPCHKLDAKSTGPALRDVDSLVFIKWMLRKNHKINNRKIEEWGIDYHRTVFTEYVKEKNLESIVDYCSTKRDY
ncbi:c-type cytochrome [Flavobacterium sp. 2]|uniref:c-type cytochrome n=1 Tax=Flavobacterium sp. 2 TaxID=308053 RepID=UPI003CF32FDD